MTAGYFYTYNAIFDTAVSGSAKLVYAYLCKCADTDGKSYPSHKAIGAAAGIGVTTVKKALAELETSGLVGIRGQARPDRGRRANIYMIIKEKVRGFFLTYANIFAKELTAKARLVYLYFCRLASGRDRAFPTHKTTANACGLSVSGTRAAIDELEAAGLVARQAQYRDNGGQRSNLYTIAAEPDSAETVGETPREPGGFDTGCFTPNIPGAEDTEADCGNIDGETFSYRNTNIEPDAGGNGRKETRSNHSVKTEELVGCDAERGGDPVNGDYGQTVDRGAFKMADCGVTQIGLLRKLKLTHAASLAEELDFESDVFQKLIFFFCVCFSADRHLPTSLHAVTLSACSSLFYSLTKRRLHINVVKRYNIVVRLHHRKREGCFDARVQQNAPPIRMAERAAVLRQPG
jgi:predicted ArsR family transcriptional regulator